MPTRRQLIISTGTLVAGGTAVALSAQETGAQLSTEINGLSVPNKSIETNTPIKTLTLSVDASYHYETSVVPDKLQLRLQAKTGSDWTQIDAVNATVDGTEFTNTITLDGSLLPLSGLDSLVPTERGKTNSETIEVRLVLTARYDGREIGTADTQTTTEITATRSSVSIGLSVGGSGSLEVTTETPTE